MRTPGRRGNCRDAARRRHGGYTVVEVVMAISVLGLGAMGVIGMQKAALYNNTNARNLAAANGIAQAWMRGSAPMRWRGTSRQGRRRLSPPRSRHGHPVGEPGRSGLVRARGGGVGHGHADTPTLTHPAGAAVADVMGADLYAGDTMAPAFCTQIRLTRFCSPPACTPTTGALAGYYRLIRAEVRVFWAREVGQAFNCAAGASAGNDATFATSAEQGNYGLCTWYRRSPKTRPPRTERRMRMNTFLSSISVRRRRQRGFTLVEVFVALCAGVLVSMAAFLVSKNATDFFQNEARISTAQLALTVGMNRLIGDIQRASFLSTRNIQADPAVCHPATWPTALNGFNRIAGLQISNGYYDATNPTPAQSVANNLYPDEIVIGGSMNSSEVFAVQCVTATGSGIQLQLQLPQYDNAMARMLAAATDVTSAANTFANYATNLGTIFATGRFVNLFDPSRGVSSYGIIAGFTPPTAGTAAFVQIAGTPGIQQRGPGVPCGIDPVPNCRGNLLVSVVSRVKYRVGSLIGVPPYTALLAPPASAAGVDLTGDTGRTELIRVELDANENELTPELVAEYAVDLRFGVTVSTKAAITGTNGANPITPYNPTASSFSFAPNSLGAPPPANSPVYAAAGPVDQGTTPQLIRSVQVRLSTRARAPERPTDLPIGNDGRRLRFFIPLAFNGTLSNATTSAPQFARVRTNYANVSLPNQGGFSLW